MATLKEQIKTQKDVVASAKTAIAYHKKQAEARGLKTSPEVKNAEKTLKDAEAKLLNLTNLQTRETESLKKKKDEEKTKQQVESGTYRPTNLPFVYDETIINGISAALGTPIDPSLSAQGGIGGGILVYEGTRTQPGRVRRGRPSTAKDNVALTTDVTNRFWQDKTIQNKVLSALVASGKTNANQLDAFATWQSVVQQSAQLYNGGKGPKFTPMDILNMSITKAGGGGPAGPDVTQYIQEVSAADIKSKIKDYTFQLLKKEPKDDDPIFNQLVSDIQNLYKKGVTSTTTVNPKTGKKTVVQTPSVTNAMIEARIDKAYKNSTDWLEAKSLEGADLFSQWMRS